jgi:hypothetical protein
MKLALQWYEHLVDVKEWKAPSKSSEKIIAKIDQLTNPKKEDKSNDDSPVRKTKRDDAWKKEKPTNGEKTKVMNGRTFNWCKWHKAWVIHNPANCLLADKDKKPPAKLDANNKLKPKTKTLTVDPALQAIINQESDEEEYDE